MCLVRNLAAKIQSSAEAGDQRASGLLATAGGQELLRRGGLKPNPKSLRIIR